MHVYGSPKGQRYVMGYLRVGVDDGGVTELHTFMLSTQNFKTQKNYTGFVLKTWNVCMHMWNASANANYSTRCN